tara:strand:- start:1528 stop:1641 length:114 start_codon:yes stop_codon:yes gene_type:complete
MRKEEQENNEDNRYCIACDDCGCKYCYKTNPYLEGGE